MTARTCLTAAATLTVAGALVLAGAGTADAATHGRKTVSVGASSRHHATAPRTTQPGVAHLHNTSSHELLLVRKKSKGVSTLVKDLKDDSDSPKLVKDFDVVEAVVPHADDYLKFTKGTYYLVDGTSDSVKASDVATITVTGRTSNTHVPGSRLVEIDSHKLTAPPAMIKGNYLHLVNATSSLRIFFALGIKSSATAKQIQDAINDPSGDGMQSIASGVSGLLGVLGGRHDVTTHSTLGRGRYFVFSIDISSNSDVPAGPHWTKVVTVR